MEGQIEDKARTYGAKRLRIEGEARTEGEAQNRAGEGSEEGLGEPLFRKFVKIETVIIIFLLISLFSFTMRGVVVKPPKATMYRGVKVPRGDIWEWFSSPSLKICANSKIKICKSMVV